MAALQGCGDPDRLPAVPAELTDKAVIPGLTEVRYRPGVDSEKLWEEGKDALRRERAWLASQGNTGEMPPVYFLAISGGGDKGAFGAGLLNGWSKAGTRPEFKLVTGISTGAIIAPFAFLGSEYDSRIEEFYTQSGPGDIHRKRPFYAILRSDSVSDNAPLWRRVEQEITREVLDAIAAEYEKGRLLFIGTADLDSGLGSIWNMTKIAASPDLMGLELFRSIIIASAALPAIFPPVMIDVEVEGKKHQEMHVDGGVLAQTFIYPPSLDVDRLTAEVGLKRERVLYIIRNSRLDPEWESVERDVLSMAKRSISLLSHRQGLGNLYRIYLTAQNDGVDYNLAYIPETFNEPHREMFDTGYMRALYRTAYEMAARGYPWAKVPPDFEER
jgi:predicted acylesterase/phospholipase RssA